MRDDPLLQPCQVGHLTLKNRLLITGHEPGYAEDGLPKDRYRAYHVARARGGVALTMTMGSASVAPDSAPSSGGIEAFRDEIVPWMHALAQDCHDEGCAVMIQLTHHGRRTRWDRGDWLPTVSSSQEREISHRHAAKLAEDWDISRIIEDYATAAERMHEAGLDGVEFLATGHLLDQFWSPRSNHLDAPYGGSLENRMRLAMEVLTETRRRVGSGFLLGLRYAGDEMCADGVDAEEGLEISRRLKESGLVDFVNVTRGHIDTDAGLTDMIPVHGMRSAPHLAAAARLREATGIPVFHAAKVADVATARHAIATGMVDMIGMTRAHLADPDIVRRIEAGQEDRIRPCVGVNFCLDRRFQGAAALCAHNPSTGREQEQPHSIAPADVSRRVLVIGAGPGGLEAARVAAERGHDVELHEAANDPGGQVRLIAQSERRREILSLIGWRMAECDRLGVQFHFNSLAEPETVLGSDADLVIIATGGLPHDVPLRAGQDLPVSSWDILSGDARPGQNVLVFDNAGDAAGLQAAEMIAATGARVEIVSPDRALSSEVMPMTLTPFLREVQGKDVHFTVTWRLNAVRREGNRLLADLCSDYSTAQMTREVDQVVVNNGTVPLDDLYFALKPHSCNFGEMDRDALLAGRSQDITRNPDASFSLFRIGDAVASRNIHAAVYDGLRLVRTL
ncbi:2,4-dienoyl-CoA reductase-like NADH-dependent reductase (Old Yellow Enzyme family)/thioredoxin reductase [Roseovarius sp. MBR-78]|jgi:2,4-dienoyl-CoA reductase-like NADH-dependent reductase (Old Yellow Enzyme family)/thioredoxin reductase|uniref:NADH:flavin oxidoreductase n=1 Tax=Roseovarius sp. MBR-78 TaxID=3156460 RepID=UPI003391EB1F